MWIKAWTARPDLGATANDMRELWWAYCFDLAVEHLASVPQMWICGVTEDGA